MKKLFLIALIIVVTACSQVKVGKEYVLIAGTTVAFDKEVAKRLNAAIGKEIFKTIASSNKTERVGFGVTVLLTDKDGAICEITEGTVVGYVSCDSFVVKEPKW